MDKDSPGNMHPNTSKQASRNTCPNSLTLVVAFCCKWLPICCASYFSLAAVQGSQQNLPNAAKRRLKLSHVLNVEIDFRTSGNQPIEAKRVHCVSFLQGF